MDSNGLLFPFYVCAPGEDLFQVRGQNGLLHNCKDPLPEISGKQEVSDTADHVLETFYPVSPTIDLQKVNVYKEEVNCTGEKTASHRNPGLVCHVRGLSSVRAQLNDFCFIQLGFRGDYPYPHAHTLYFLEGADACCKLRPEQFRAKMVMFTFGNALARAHRLYGVRK